MIRQGLKKLMFPALCLLTALGMIFTGCRNPWAGDDETPPVAVTGVALNKTATGILVGGSERLDTIITPANATNQNVSWLSSNPGVVTVSSGGMVRAVSAGTATITVTTVDGGFTESCTVTVSSIPVAVSGVSLNKTATAILVGGSETLFAIISPADATDPSVGWESNAPGVATVSGGVVTAVSVGTATITVTTVDGGYTADCTVTVSSTAVAVSGVSLNKTTLSLAVGGSETLTATVSPANATNQNVSWSSNTPGVATVSGGTVNAVSAGTAVITVTTAEGAKTATCAVTVTFAPSQQDIHTLSGVSVPFRFVPAGSFRRDSGGANVGVITTGYWMGETEVTQELFQAVMGTNPSYFISGADGGETQNRRPVENINWYAAIAFCNKLSLANGKEPVYSVSGVNWNTLTYNDIPIGSNSAWDDAIMNTAKNGYRLPTMMEWMWTAMGADMENPGQRNTSGYSKAFAGSNGSNSVGIGNYAWYDGNSGNKTHETGKKAANELGLRDMTGNVCEWCWDRFGSVPAGTLTDYTGADSGTFRRARGGRWSDLVAYCTVANSGDSEYPSYRGNHGFRVVCP
ncbi:MAG: Ig-like domain-containing protein [Spirochaetales bacterium]|jgi:uncharacterized protein YjdB|nr:Ig-like domain-containing protein [Spirochaetales bacterium]